MNASSPSGSTPETQTSMGAAARDGVPFTNAAELFELLAQVRSAHHQILDHFQTSATALSQQCGEVEVLLEWVRRLETNLHEAKNHVETLATALDRIKIVALNTGLEGARLGDLAGKALMAVSDELRSLTSRGLELLSEHVSTVEQMEADRQRLDVMTDRIQSHLSDLDASLREATSSGRSGGQLLSRLESALQQSSGLDAETALRLGKISEQARGLVALVTDLSKPEQQQAMRTALLPAIEPLLVWLSSTTGKVP